MYCVFKRVYSDRIIPYQVPAGSKKFSTYEQARQWVRKVLRKKEPIHNFWWTSNPMIGDYGYFIRKLKNG